jgi:hypothetical protein
MKTPTEVLIEVVRVLEDLQIPYVVVGSFASSARGVRRATVDVDLVAELTLDHVRPIVDRLSHDYYIDDQAVRRAINTQRAFNALHLESMFKVDVHISKDNFTKKEIERKLPEKILPGSDTIVYIATAEDTVVAKLSWYRKGGEVSDQQWSDVLGVLKLQNARLDGAYMREWSERLGVRDLLDQAICEAS